MIQLTLSEVAALTGGAIHGNPSVVITGSVETDSRLVASGSLFFAKPGEVTDGHNFIENAKAAGAAAAVVERLVEVSDFPQLVVGNVVTALGLLAKGVLAKQASLNSKLKVVGITGSNGKTTTKNMLRAILSSAGEVVAPIESYNNEVGAPISVLKVSDSTDFLVAELGAGGPGSIRYLANIVQPDIAVILKVGLAHAGEFGGIESTAKIKAELLENLTKSNIAVLNLDDQLVAEMANETSAQIVWFGTSEKANYQAANHQLTLEGTSFDLRWPDGSQDRVTLKILGEHHVMNALASAAVADILGISRTEIVNRLEAMPLAERWRMEVGQRSDGLMVINDAYNASPDSTKAALQTLATLGRISGRRTVAVLGEMAELGRYASEEHDAIGRLAVRLNLGLVVAIGPNAKLIYMGASQEGSWDSESQYFESIEAAELALKGLLKSTDIVLVKSSKLANLRYLGDRLLEVND